MDLKKFNVIHREKRILGSFWQETHSTTARLEKFGYAKSKAELTTAQNEQEL